MKLAFLHYHLNRGGVTRVIEGHLRALQRAREKGFLAVSPGSRLPVLVLYGGRAEGWPWALGDSLPALAIHYKALSCLDYDSEQGTPPTPDLVTAVIEEALQEAGFLPQETILHVHNHSVGKNAALPEALFRLAARGWRILLQIHDFVEDFRPANFRHLATGMLRWGNNPRTWQGRLYPQAAHVHYAVLTHAAAAVLARSGVPTERIHYLPNPIAMVAHLPSRAKARKKVQNCLGLASDNSYWLYPVRAIRRKNIGEAVLLAALGGSKVRIGISLPATSPTETPAYHFWRRLAQDLCKNVYFELALQTQADFATHLAAADRVLTTSLAEGFGLSFLEPWVCDRELVGRDLPEVVDDFRNLGVKFERLYRQLVIPASVVDIACLRSYLRNCYREVLECYGVDAPETWWEQLDEKVAGKTLDFGDLDELDQARIINRVVDDKSFQDQILEENPLIKEWLTTDSDPRMIAANKERVLDNFGLESIGRRLVGIYEALMANGPQEEPRPLDQFQLITEQFLTPERFRLIRSGKLRV